MRNDVEKMNNFQNVRISNKAINLIIFYVLIVLLFEGKNSIFISSFYSSKFCPLLNTKQIFFLPYFIYYFIFS